MYRYVLTTVLLSILAQPASARTQLKNICRLKGQEENVLRGLGLVVGLNATGEAGDGPTMRAMARAMEIMGNPLSVNGPGGQQALNELRNIKNAALVMVTATIPATGARRGDKLDCYVSAFNGKSLLGGRLAFAALQGPSTRDPRVYALCQGQIHVDDEAQPMVGVIHGGCQMEADIFTPFVLNNTITLILDKHHANFLTAADIAQEINVKFRVDGEPAMDGEALTGVAHALDAANIVVQIPEIYRKIPVAFASDVLDTSVYEDEPEARVTINPRAGSIVISGNVTIGDVVVSHRNVVVEAASPPGFSSLSTDESLKPKLDQLVKQLDALKVPTDDMIEIIRGIERSGKLHGRLIVE
jgi:flagellar P-ring protein precursor FlgI